MPVNIKIVKKRTHGLCVPLYARAHCRSRARAGVADLPSLSHLPLPHAVPYTSTRVSATSSIPSRRRRRRRRPHLFCAR